MSVFESTSKRDCSDRSLVLQSIGIPYQIFATEDSVHLLVSAELTEKAKFELWQYEQENRQVKAPPPRLTPVVQNAIPGVIAYLIVITLVAVLAGEAIFDRNWFTAGRVDGVLIRDGEWWRAITALTLHSGIKHYAGNAVFGAFFGYMAGRVLGSGVTWFAVIITAFGANLLNTLLLDSSHRSIGASTAVFAVLGILAGFVWRSQLMKQDRWAYRIGPIVGGLALLAYTGTGDANTDVGAHVTGFACGFAGGLVLTSLYRYIPAKKVQQTCALLAIALISGAWMLAL
ncbi:MAG: rhomboid family intramembrane serine protease [Woeseia sp.]|nr:rhomboid family intramembrane serine protease [Woeseia sp.]MBT7255629.1 rhomboid family intramembrane serine protease [Planctomycetaceae bacterium]